MYDILSIPNDSTYVQRLQSYLKQSSKGCDPGFRSYRLKDEGVFREGAINEYRVLSYTLIKLFHC